MNKFDVEAKARHTLSLTEVVLTSTKLHRSNVS